MVANDGGDIITGNAGLTIRSPAAPATTPSMSEPAITPRHGGGGTDTVVYDAALTRGLHRRQRPLVVSDGSHGTDTLTGVQEVTDGKFLLVGDGGYGDASDASAPAAANPGDTLIVDSGSDSSCRPSAPTI